MAQIGTIRVDTQNNGTVSVPVFDTGDSGSSIYEFVRVQTGSGTGFIPVEDTSNATYPYLRVKSQSHGTVAMTDRSSAIPDSGVSRYEFEQDVTDSWSDNNGVDNTSAGFSTTSELGSFAKAFDGADDSVDAKNVADDLSGAFSVSVWVNPDTVSKTSQGILNFADSGSIDPSLFLFNDAPSWTMNDGGGGNATSSQTITSGTYYHIVGTYDGSNNSTIYVDGSQEGTNSGDDPTLSGDVAVGFVNNSSHYDGLLDELRFYNKELSGTEVSNLYNSGSISG